MTITRKIFVSFVFLLLLTTWVGYVGYQSSRELLDANEKLRRTQQVVAGIDGLLGAMADVETSGRGYLISGEEIYLRPYQGAVARLPGLLRGLRESTRGNRDQERLLDSLEPLFNEKLDFQRQLIEIRRKQNTEEARSYFMTGKGRALMERIRDAAEEIRAMEMNLLE